MDFLLITMITTKLTAVMLAVGMLSIGGLLATPMVTPAQAQNVNAAAATNEDNDVVIQENEAKIEQESKVKCEAEAESKNDDSVQVGDNTNVAANDCDTTQTAA